MIKDNHTQNAWIKKKDAEGNDCMKMIYDGRNEIRGQRLTRRCMICRQSGVWLLHVCIKNQQSVAIGRGDMPSYPCFQGGDGRLLTHISPFSSIELCP